MILIIVWKGLIYSGSDTDRKEVEGLIFYYFRPVYCLDQMLAATILSQQKSLSFKIVRTCARCSA